MASIRKRKRKDGATTWQVRQDGARTQTFVAHTRAQETQARRDALRYKLELERKRALGALHEAPPETLGAFLDAHLDRKRTRGRKPSTVKRNQEARRHLQPLEQTPIPQLRRAELEDLVNKAAARAPRQAQMALALAKGALREARERGQAVDDAIFRIEPPRYEPREARFLTLEQVYTLGSWMPEHVRRIVPVAALTGMRQGELLALTDADMELDRQRLRVHRGKTRHAQRWVALNAECVGLLREQLLARARGTALVFPTVNGLRWDASNLMEDVFRPAAVIAGLGRYTFDGKRRHYEGVVFHDLRHSFVSLAASQGISEVWIAEQVGWSPRSRHVMLGRYRHLFESERVSEAAKLDGLSTRRDDAEGEGTGA